MLLKELADKNLIHPPSFLINNTCYLTTVGSYAYGTYNDKSDFDLMGFCIPPKSVVFPHVDSVIQGFGTQKEPFLQFECQQFTDPSALGGKGRIYDLNVYNIVRYFHLIMENNPNFLGSLFTPFECVLHITQIGQMVRENRKSFLHKGCWARYKNFAFSQIHKMATKKASGKRKQLRDSHGYDVKYGMNLIRLLLEVEMILTEGDVDLRRHTEQLKAIRRGEVTEAEVRKIASDKEHQLEKAYSESKLPFGPDENKVKALLLACLEQHYGSLDKAIEMPDRYKSALLDIKKILESVGIE